MRTLMVFLQGVFALGFVVMLLVSGLMYVRHNGLSIELAQAVGLLALFLGLLLATGRQMTGRWFRWSRR
ncbi:hypothetical protein ACFW9F_00530 [Streptomyces sp. NPDC059506]|uniref:hypothetical protein n=1 Tax=Streptomyces sp. NPDC059506 TaxID=3347751 RepID=UPI003698611E